jgi:hypothetical protein
MSVNGNPGTTQRTFFGISVETAPFAVSVTWPGTYSTSSFTGFKSIDIYAVSSDLGSTTTSGISGSNLVGSLTVQDTPNKINIGLDNLRQALGLSTNADVYTTSIFYYFNSSNKNGDKFGSPTYTRINSSSIIPTKANFVDIANGVISIENLVAGNGSFSSWLRTGTSGGARIELSAISDFTNGGNTVQKGLVAYSSGNTELFNLDLDASTLTINGSGTFTGNLSIGSSNAIFKAEPATGIWLGNSTYASAPFSVSVNGVIKANSGTIGGWTLGSTFLQGTNFEINSSSSTIFVGPTSGQHIRISASGGISTYNGGTQTSGFNLSTSGSLSLSGSVTASAGSIGGWTIGSTTLTGGGTTLNSNGTVTVAGGSATTSLNNNGTISISAGSSGIGALSISGSGKTTDIYSDRMVINNSWIYESTGDIGAPPAGALTILQTSASPNREVHFFTPGSISGSVSINRLLYYVGHSTTSASGNTFINSTSGLMSRSTASSQRYKENIVDLNTVTNLNPEPLLSLPVRAFKYKTDYLSPEDTRSQLMVPGFIAEEMQEHYPIAVDYNDEGLPERWNSDYLIPAMVALIQQLNNRLDALEG